MPGYNFFDQKHMQLNNECPKCGLGVWANERTDMVWYSGKRFYDLNKRCVGVKLGSGLVFCGSCWNAIEPTIDEDETDIPRGASDFRIKD